MRARTEDSEGASAGDDAADRPWRRARRSDRSWSRGKFNFTRDGNISARSIVCADRNLAPDQIKLLRDDIRV